MLSALITLSSEYVIAGHRRQWIRIGVLITLSSDGRLRRLLVGCGQIRPFVLLQMPMPPPDHVGQVEVCQDLEYVTVWTRDDMATNGFHNVFLTRPDGRSELCDG